MKAVVVGCGRVGAGVADELDRAGWQVLIIDVNVGRVRPAARPASRGTALRGDGTDEDVLRRAGAENADLFLALTEGDNRNIMAAQLGDRGARRPQDRGQGQRPGPGRGVRASRHRDPVPDEPDGDPDPRLRSGRPCPAQPGIYVPRTRTCTMRRVTPSRPRRPGSPGAPRRRLRSRPRPSAEA